MVFYRLIMGGQGLPRALPGVFSVTSMRHRTQSSLLLRGILPLLLGFLLGGRGDGGEADTYLWRSEAGSGLWNVQSHWWRDGENSPDTDGSGKGNLEFNNNDYVDMTNDFDLPDRWKITFAAGATVARTIYGSTENTFKDASSNIPKIENNSTAHHVIKFPVKLGYSSGLEINPVLGDLTLDGTVDLTSSGYDVHVWGDNDKMLTLNGVVSGTGKIIVEQYSKVKLAGASTFTGDVEIDEGEFWVDSGGTLGAGTIVIGNSGQATDEAKLWLSDSDGGLTVSRNITVSSGNAGTRTIGGLNTSGVNTFSGTVTLNGPANLEAENAGGTVSFTGLISGDQDVSLNNPGTVRLTAENTFGSTHALKIDGSTLELNRASGDPLDCGEIQLGKWWRDTTLDLNSSAGFSLDNPINVRSTGGTKMIRNTAGTNAITANIYLDVALTLESAAGRVTFSGTEVDLKANTLTVKGAGDTTIRSAITNSTGTGALTKQDAGTLTLTGANTFGGATTLNGGTTVYTGTNTSSSVTIASGATLKGTGSLGAVTPNGTIAPGTSVGELDASAVTLPAGGTYAWEVGDVDGSAGTDWDLITVDSGAGTVTVSASSGAKFRIAPDDSGISNFDKTHNYTWTIINAFNLSGFDASDFEIDDSGWSSDKGSGVWRVSESSGDLLLHFDGEAPAIGAGPDTMTFSVPLGTTPSSQNISVTNAGGQTWIYTNTVTYGPGWGSMNVTVTDPTGSLGGGASALHTVAPSQATAVGAYAATNTIDGNQTNGTHEVDITLTVTNLPGSTECRVLDNVGPESMSVNWTRPGAYNVMVVRRAGGPPDPPTNGTTYTVNQTYGPGNRTHVVVAPGIDVSVTDMELVPDTSYSYAFYTENFTYYSVATGTVASGMTMVTNTPPFRFDERVDAFAYFAYDDLNGKDGGSLWTNAWVESDAGAFTVQPGS